MWRIAGRSLPAEQRPTLQAMSALRDLVAGTALERLPAEAPRRILIVSAGGAQLIERVLEQIVGPATLTVLDQGRDLLARAQSLPTPEDVGVHTVQEKLVDFATGRSVPDLWPKHVIVLHGLLEYLPAPLAVALADTCRGLLAPDGVVVASSVRSSPDHVLLDRLLAWPMIRRTPEEVASLFEGAGFRQVIPIPSPAPAHLVVAEAPATSP